ncbi:hypothetical protein ACO22_05809 [Paracoccidioides brasiliensis]|uniref:Uncharacterized protein n=1 Tax=Paracoccidioides brasiliensis TaxID=121759 RepID=A0A1D2J981_PARBR|nr:hypothetical protein ACO22_05809 [Paracoccidioides brasiliensis]ODH46727.1 hypothetical protein GX48_07183 [Paracoccidioides brasiliensis]
MVLGIFTITAIPTVVGVSQGVSEQRKENQRQGDEKRLEKFYLDVFCDTNSDAARGLYGRRMVLRDNKIYLDSPSSEARSIPSHTAEAFYIAYPDDQRKPTLGLVSTISADPPMLNWIYLDRHTLELKYGNRTQSREHFVGPWDWTEDEMRLTLHEIEEFAAVEEEEGVWAVYFDWDGDGLKGSVRREKKVVEISLERHMVKAEDESGKEKGDQEKGEEEKRG